mgnify:CR=1 FL=1
MKMQSRIEQIYQEGARLFSRNGFEGTSIRHVANACGISLSAIHYHFTTKEELHNEITQFCFETFMERIVAQRKKLPRDQDRPSTLLAIIFDAITEDATLFNLMLHDLQHLNPDLRRARSWPRHQAVVSLVGDSMRNAWGKQPDEASVVAAAGLIAGYCEVLQADERSSGPDRDRFISDRRMALIRIIEQTFDRPIC